LGFIDFPRATTASWQAFIAPSGSSVAKSICQGLNDWKCQRQL
jgi:hypothetical protein